MFKILRFNFQQRSKNGYLLIEAIVAISLLIIGFLGALKLVSDSLSLNKVVADQFAANYLAMEGVEITRNLMGNNVLQGNPWNAGFNDGCYDSIDYTIGNISFASNVLCSSGSNLPLNFDQAANFYSYGNGIPTNFKRTIEINNISQDEILITSTVNWENRMGSFNVKVQDYFFNWY